MIVEEVGGRKERIRRGTEAVLGLARGGRFHEEKDERRGQVAGARAEILTTAPTAAANGSDG